VHATTLEAIASIAPDPRLILDVGAGTGRLARKVAQRFPGARVVGVDPAPGMVEEARRVGGPEFLVAPAERLPFEEGTFDVAVSTFSFHHWEDHARGLLEVRRVLRDGGALAVTDAFPSGAYRIIKVFRHGRVRAVDELPPLLASAGFVRWRRVPVPGMHGVVAAVLATR